MIPASPTSGAPPVPDSPAIQRGSGRILVIDDEVYIRDIATTLLTSLGYDVATSRDGTEAIALFSDAHSFGNPFCAVILDLTIPGGNEGKETIGELVKLDGAARIIASSGYGDDPARFGFAASISKPYRKAEIAEVLGKGVA